MGVIDRVKAATTAIFTRGGGEQKIIEASTQYVFTGAHMQAFENFSPWLGVGAIGGWRYAAMNLNANAFASTPLRMYMKKRKGKTPTFQARSVDKKKAMYLRRNASKIVRTKAAAWNDEYVEVENELPPLALLNNVNDFQDGYDFAWARAIYGQATGNAYVGIVKNDRGMPTQLWTLPAQWTQVVPDRVRYVAGYIYGQNQADREWFDADEIMHFKWAYHPANQWYGLGPMEAGWNIVCQDIARNVSDLSFWSNYARPDYIVSIDGANDPATFDRVKSQIEARNKGVTKAGRFLAIQGNVKFQPMQFAPKDLGELDHIIQQLAAAFGVPVTILQANDPNLASATVGYATWRANTILSMCQRDEQMLNQRYLPMFPDMQDAFLAYDSPVKDDETARATRSVSLVGAGIMTPNEARHEEGMEPIAGGDALRDPTGMAAFDVPYEEETTTVQTATDAPALPAGEATAAKPSDTQAAPANATAEGLNGAQITSAVTVITEMQAGVIAPETARELLIALGIDPQAAARMIAAQSKLPKPEPVEETPAPTPEPAAAKSITCCVVHQKNYGGAVQDWPASVKEARKAVEAQPEDDGGDADENVRAGEPETVAMKMRRDVRAVLAQQCKDIGAALEQLPDEKVYRVMDVKGVQIKAAQPWLEELIRLALGPNANAELAKAFLPSVRGAMGAGARYGLERVNADVDAFSVTNPKVAESLDKYTLDLAGKINDDTVNMVARNIQSGLSQGQSVSEIAATYSNQLPDNLQINPQARSVVIARTETARAYVNGQEEGWKASGVVSGKQWLLAIGSCPFCEATAAKFNNENKAVPLGKPFYKKGDKITTVDAEGKPVSMKLDYSAVEGAPLHPNCFPAGTQVAARGIVAGYRAFYAGKMIKILTAHGRELTVTPNHQLVSSGGLVAAQSLNKGDYLLNGTGLKREMLGNPDANQAVSCIEEVFTALAKSGGVASARVPVSPEYLHGDARFCNGAIDVVRSNRLLMGDIEPSGCEHVKHLPLSAGWNDDRLAGLSAPDLAFHSARLASDSVMRMLCQRPAFVGSHVGMTNEHTSGLISLDKSSDVHVLDQGLTTNAEALAGLQDRFPGLMAFDQIVDIQVDDFAGHVFDLQTETGVYIANDVIVGNCRCDIEPVLED